MDINEIEKLVAILKGSEVSELEYEREGTTIRITRAVGVSHTVAQAAPQTMVSFQAPVAVESSSASVDEGLIKVESPIVGTFYKRSSPDAEPFVSVGTRVNKGDTLCIVEAMKLMNEIEAPVSGVVERVNLDDGNVVEYGEVLFLIRP